ncbi:hypothetical protein MKX78_08990 [Cytobacillus sp. FSL R5-0569]|uniref:hypothetical protein n=1 Tax=Cytobacillus sp. FSL R5-0569 TaxID=2921649 RepID=UPI0030FB0FCE
MKKGRLSKGLKGLMVLILLFSLIGNIPVRANAEEQEVDIDFENIDLTAEEEILAEELASELQFLVEEGAIVDEENDILLGFDEDVLDARYTGKAEYQDIKNMLITSGAFIDKNDPGNGAGNGGGNGGDNDVEPPEIEIMALKKENPKFTAAVNSCLKSEVKASFGLTATTATVEGIKSMIKKGQYKKAAQAIIKFGIKSSIVGTGVLMVWIVANCEEKALKKHKKWL